MPTALIVEDEPAANQLLSMLVGLRGYETNSAFTGKDAIKKAEEQRPDVVFLDLMLPDINGYEVCKALKECRTTNEIPVVMVTARLAAENRIQGFRAGVIDYVPKPYTPDQIFQAMKRASNWRSHMRELPGSTVLEVKADDDVAYLQQASDIRSLLLSRTTLDEPSIGRLNSALVDILNRGVEWGRKNNCNCIARLGVEVERNHVALTIHDDSGWLRDDDPREDGLARLLADGGFDCVEFCNGRDLRLTCDLPCS